MRTSFSKWKKSATLVAALFLIIAVISDVFFFAVWRGIPDELYHPTTFAAYALILLAPVIVSIILKRVKDKKQKPVSLKSLCIAGGLGVLCFAFTLYSVQYW